MQILDTGAGNRIRRIDYNFKDHGLVGHMSLPKQFDGHGVIVIMGGEKSLLPGTVIADRFADYGIMALSVSLFGAKGLGKSVDRIPLEMFVPAVRELREKGLYAMLPLVGCIYRTLGKYRKECLNIFEKSEKEIIDWILTDK